MPVFRHPQALVETDDIGDGTRVWAFAHVMAGARIGRGCNIGDHAFVESGAVIGNNVTIKNYVAIWNGVTIEDDVFLGPHATLTNDLRPRSRQTNWTLKATRIRRGATIGANATVVCGIEVGEFAFVGAGAVVAADVEPHALSVGNPARRRGYVCRCAEPLTLVDGRSRCAACGTAFEIGDDGRLRERV